MAKHYEQLKHGEDLLKYSEEEKKNVVIGYEKELTWDEKQKTLVLTIDAVSNELQVDLVKIRKDRENAIAHLRELSQLLYSYILRKKPAILKEKTEYYLKYDMRNRRIIYLCLLDLIRYSLYGGGNIIGYQPGVHLNDGDVLDIEKMRDERVMSFVTDSILKTNFLVDRNFVESFDVPDEEW